MVGAVSEKRPEGGAARVWPLTNVEPLYVTTISSELSFYLF